MARMVRMELEPLLCHACGILESHDLLTLELQEWWQKHKLVDECRRQRYAAEAAAAVQRQARQEYLQSVKDRLLKQLTDEEREALRV